MTTKTRNKLQIDAQQLALNMSITPTFDRNQNFGHTERFIIVSDDRGTLWKIDGTNCIGTKIEFK